MTARQIWLRSAGIAHSYNRFCYWQKKFQSSPSPVFLLHVSTVAQVPVLALAKFNDEQLQCEFVQAVLVIKSLLNDVYTHISPQSCLQEHCLHGSPRRCRCNFNSNQKSGRISGADACNDHPHKLLLRMCSIYSNYQ